MPFKYRTIDNTHTMNKKTLLYLAAVTSAATLSSQATIVWSGLGADTSPFTADNWDFTGSMAAPLIIGNVDILDNVVVNGATASGEDSALGFAQFRLGEGFGATITNSTFDITATDGFGGSGAGATETVDLINSSSSIQFLAWGVDINVDATSSLTIRGGGDGINSQIAESHVNLLTGGSLTLPTAAEVDEQIGEGDIYANGVLVTALNKATLLSGTGATVTALAPVPEPSSTALLGLGGLALILRRRK